MIGGRTDNEGRAQALVAAMFDWISQRKQLAIRKLGTWRNDRANDVITGDLRGDILRW